MIRYFITIIVFCMALFCLPFGAMGQTNPEKISPAELHSDAFLQLVRR